jgi:outer membrane scaffolding protein for murein synthesis (MipA/OmpV family)
MPARWSLPALAGTALAAAAAGATPLGAVPEAEPGVNIIALAWGRVPDHAGSNESVSGVAPLVRLQGVGERYVQLVGTELSWNAIDDAQWRVGPQLGLRPGRKKTLDPVVRQMTPIDGEIEVGAFATRVWRLGDDTRHLLNISADVLRGTGRGHGGWVGGLRINVYVPVSRAVLLNAGVGRGFGNGAYTAAYWGVGAGDAGLFPSLGGRAFTPGTGWTDWRITYGAVVHLSPQWHLVAGGRWLQLDSRISRSPIVSERGTRSSNIIGVGLGHVWR